MPKKIFLYSLSWLNEHICQIICYLSCIYSIVIGRCRTESLHVFFFPFLKVVAAWLICLRMPCFGFCRLLAYHVIIKRSLICYFLFPLNMHLTLLFWTEKENGPRTVKDVKLISAGKILENNRTLGECRSPLCDIPGGVTTMHVVVQPPSTEKGKISLFWKNRGNECCLIIQTHILLLLLSCCFGLGTLEPCTKLTEYYISRLMRFLSSLLRFFFFLSFWGKKLRRNA